MRAELHEAREAIEAIGEELDLTLSFTQFDRPREQLLVNVVGKRQYVHEVTIYLLNHCPHVHLDLISAEHVNHLYRMTLMIGVKADEGETKGPEMDPRILDMD